MGSLSNRVHKLEGGGRCPECGHSSGEPWELVLGAPLERGERPRLERCETCGEMVGGSFTLQLSDPWPPEEDVWED